MRAKKSVFSVLDLFLVVLLIVSAAGITARYMLTDKNGVLASRPERTRAAVSVLVTDIENTSSDFFSEGAVFGFGGADGEAQLLAVTITPAEYYAENEDGELVIAYHDEENGKIDVRCTISVSGYYRDGIYLSENGDPVLPGSSVTLTANGITVTALILDVTSIE